MLELLGEGNVAALIGAFGGILLGLAARLGRFCTLGAIEDYFYGGKDTRLRMWVLATGVAMLGSFLMSGAGLVDETRSFYLAQSWLPVAAILGGLIFGYGMAIAGNCGYGAVARLGGGDLRNFVIVVVMGLAAYATISGPIALLRVEVFPSPGLADAPQSYAHLIAGTLPVPAWIIGAGIGVVICAAALWPAAFRQDRKAVFWSGVVGLAVVSAWAGMTYLSNHGFDDLAVVSHTFAAPVGETMLYAMTASGQDLSFGIGSVAGVWVGALIGSLVKGHFRWEACEDPRELRRQIIGAAMMGVGAVLALGCSIGQGLSAMSLLAYSAPFTFAAILLGAWLGLKHLIEGVLPAFISNT